jgi:hypothetical protein
MTAYGFKTYGTFKYGVAPSTDISVYPFTTQSLDYGSIKLSWVYPLVTGSFTTFTILRNPTGFPITADNGDLIYTATKTSLSNSNLLGKTATLTDTGGFYDPISGNFTTTYSGIISGNIVNSKTVNLTTVNSNIAAGQIVSYTPSGNLTGANSGSGVIGGTTVTAVTTDSTGTYTIITLSDYATIPDKTTLTFSPTGLTLGKTYYYSAFVLSNGTWQRVGTAIGTSIKNYKTADTMYDSLPEVYRAALPTSSSTNANKNVDLYNFLRVFGVQHDFIKTKVENAKNRYDTANLDGRLIPALMGQMGFTYESGMGLQQARRLLKNANYIYLNKGTGQGIKQFISSFSGYTASIASFKNLFLTLDCSSFEYGDGFWSTTGSRNVTTFTTAALEGGSPLPVSISTSPNGYPNSQLGYLKSTSLSSSGGAFSTYEFSYGVSQDAYTISTVQTGPSVGYNYVTITADSEHSFKVGQYVVISNMNPTYLNGIQQITAVPDSKSFTFYSANATSSMTIQPYGSAVIPTGTITGGTLSATITTSALHYIIPGQSVTISGVVPALFNGTTTPINGTYVAAAGTQNTTLVLTLPTSPSNTTVTAAGSTFVSPGTVSLYDVKNASIPVTAGGSYFFSIYTQAKTVGRGITTGVRWYDQYGTYLTSAATGTNSNVTGSWTRVSSSFPSVAPPSAAYAAPYVSYSTTGFNEVHYFDCAQFELVPGSLTTPYVDSRRVDIYLGASRINNIINPGFESSTSYVVPTQTPTYSAPNITLSTSTAHAISVGSTVTLSGFTPSGYNGTWTAQTGTTGSTLVLNIGSNPGAITVAGTATCSVINWTATNTTAFTTDAANVYPTASVGLGTAVSAASAKLTLSAGTSTLAPTNTIAVTGGNPYALSAYFKAANANVTPSVVWKNVSGSTLRTDTATAAISLNGTTFTRVSMIPASGSSAMIAPATATTATITFTFSSAGTTAYVDSVLFESSYTANNYFDGSTGYNVSDDITWEQNAAGTAGTSTTGRSVYYPNRQLVQSRLNTVLSDYVPIGTNYALFFGQTAT